MLAMSSGSSFEPDRETGAASRPFKRIASPKRSFPDRTLPDRARPRAERRLLDALDDRQIQILARAPRVIQNRRQQDVLAALHRIGVHAQQRQARWSRSSSPLPPSARRHHAPPRAARRTTSGWRPGCLRGCRACRPRSRPSRAASRCARRPVPTRRGPSSTFRLVRRERVDRLLLTRGFVRIDPRLEIAGREIGKGEQQVREIALRIDRDDGNAVDQRFFEQRDAESRLAAARHADDDAVRDEVAGVVEDRLGGQLFGREIVLAPQVEAPERLERLGGCGIRHDGHFTRLAGRQDRRRPRRPLTRLFDLPAAAARFCQ